MTYKTTQRFLYENVGLTDVEDLAILLYGHHVCTPGAPQILDSAPIVVPSRWHRTELRRRHDGRQPSRFLHNVFVWRKMSYDIDDHTKQIRSPHDGTKWPHDGLTMKQIGLIYDINTNCYFAIPSAIFLTCPRFFDRSRCCWRCLIN